MDIACDVEKKTGICRWCTKEAAGHFCVNCHGPLSLVGAFLFSTNLVLKLLAVPASLLFISYELSTYQQAESRSHDDQQRLVTAYGEFAAQLSSLYAAETEVKLLASSQQDVPKKDVQAAISEANRSFAGIRAKLTAFEMIETRDLNTSNVLGEAWEKCFTYSYYTERLQNTREDGYWKQLTTELALCRDGACQTGTVHEIGNVLWKVHERPVCHEFTGVAQPDISWVWHRLSAEMSCARTSNVTACLAQSDGKAAPRKGMHPA